MAPASPATIVPPHWDSFPIFIVHENFAQDSPPPHGGVSTFTAHPPENNRNVVAFVGEIIKSLLY
jgi:hypothetical protein